MLTGLSGWPYPPSAWRISCYKSTFPDPCSHHCLSKIFLSNSTGGFYVWLKFWSVMGFPTVDISCRASCKQQWPSQHGSCPPCTYHHCLPLWLKPCNLCPLMLICPIWNWKKKYRVCWKLKWTCRTSYCEDSTGFLTLKYLCHTLILHTPKGFPSKESFELVNGI